jgi:hypothetical protein
MSVLDELLQGCDQFEVDRAFVLACENGDLDLVKECLNNTKLAYNADLGNHSTDGLLYAIDGNHPHLVEYFLFTKDIEEHLNIDVSELLSFKFPYNETSLDIMKLVLRYAKENKQDIPHQLPFHNACQVENITTIKLFLSDEEFNKKIGIGYQLACFEKFLLQNKFNLVHFFLTEDSLDFRVNVKYFINLINDSEKKIDPSIHNLLNTFDFHNNLNKSLSKGNNEIDKSRIKRKI